MRKDIEEFERYEFKERKNFRFLKLLSKILVLLIVFLLGRYSYISENNVINSNTLDKINVFEKYINDNFVLEKNIKNMQDGLLRGMFLGLGDPYSFYMTKEEVKKDKEMIEGSFVGVGINIKASPDNRIVVISPIEGGPAEKAGILAGDIINKIDGKEYKGENLSEAVKATRGIAGKKVNLEILRPNGNDFEVKNFEIIREEILEKSVYHQKINDLGYIRIKSFLKATDIDFKKAYDELKALDVKGIVIDLRNNGGGLLSSCANIMDMFLDDCQLVKIHKKSEDLVLMAKDNLNEKIPLVFLGNESTASASEVMIGTFKDYGRAKFIGVKTYGKGISQNVFVNDDGSGCQITNGVLELPSGRRYHKEGILPDFEVKLPENVKNIGVENLNEDVQLQKAIEVLSKEIR